MMKEIYVLALLASVALGCQSAIVDPCPDTPATGSAGSASTSTSMSHNAGQDCLSCHDGSAAVAFDVGGTKVSGFFSSEVAPAGSTVENVGGATMTVDQCGNFFAVTNAVTTTQPSTAARSMIRAIPGGSCNSSGCHDGSAQSHIY